MFGLIFIEITRGPLVWEGFSSCSIEILSWKCWNAKKKIWWHHTSVLYRVTHVTSTDLGSKVIWSQWPLVQIFEKRVTIHILWCIFVGLGHNDPWVESHMWPQQTWGQRSSCGQWPLVHVFEKMGTVSTYFDVVSNLILQWLQRYVIAKAGETRGSRTASLEWRKDSYEANQLKNYPVKLLKLWRKRVFVASFILKGAIGLRSVYFLKFQFMCMWRMPLNKNHDFWKLKILA